MSRVATGVVLCLCAGALVAVPAGAQSFGAQKEKVTLHRKLPALIHLTGQSVKVIVPGQDTAGDVSYDLQALLETELLKDDPNLRVEANNPDVTMTCNITGYYHPAPSVTNRASMTLTGYQNQDFTRVNGSLQISFQVKNAAGQMLITDNVEAKYDEEFDAMGNSTSHGMKGSIGGTFKRLKGGSSEEMNPPTDAELRSKLLLDAVQQIAEHVVNTNESLDVFLAKQKGPLEEGDKLAETDLWERALETFETAPELPKPDEDAYRLYDIGVAYEALAYQADDAKMAMKYLDQAAINYGKAIDDKPAEKYFLEPQKRIETAIAHYKELEEESKPKPPPVVANNVPPTAGGATKAAGPKALTNTQIIAMVKSGMDDDTVIQTVRAAKVISFDLTAAGLQELTAGGVSPSVVTAMKARAARKPPAAGAKPAATSATAKPVASK
jgi:tetratricopeptide (TPR) repeat protein